MGRKKIVGERPTQLGMRVFKKHRLIIAKHYKRMHKAGEATSRADVLRQAIEEFDKNHA